MSNVQKALWKHFNLCLWVKYWSWVWGAYLSSMTPNRALPMTPPTSNVVEHTPARLGEYFNWKIDLNSLTLWMIICWEICKMAHNESLTNPKMRLILNNQYFISNINIPTGMCFYAKNRCLTLFIFDTWVQVVNINVLPNPRNNNIKKILVQILIKALIKHNYSWCHADSLWQIRLLNLQVFPIFCHQNATI